MHEQYFRQLQQVWDASRQLAARLDVDENKAWERFQQRVSEARPVAAMPLRRIYWWRIAAAAVVIAIISLAGYLFFGKENAPQELIVQAAQQVLNDTLPDGSTITLNKNSSIGYPERFTGDTRNITLKGEAFFHVAPDKSKPFIISVNDVTVTVVGTSFNIKTEKAGTEVVVETGIVRVTRKNQTVELKAGEKIMVPRTDSLPAKEEVTDQLYNYYRTKEFVCDDTPLWKLVEVLNEAYDTKIVIGRPDLRDFRLNATFYNESLDQVLNVISLTFNITVSHQGNQIVLQ